QQQPQQPYWPQQPGQQPFPFPQAPGPLMSCNDKRQCSYWTKNGFCNHTFYNDNYKKEKCANACGLCTGTTTGACVDTIQQCASYISLGYCSIPGGMQACCATCSSQPLQPTNPANPAPGGTGIGSVLGGLGNLVPGLGGGGGTGNGQQPNPLGALGSALGGLTGRGGNPLSAIGNTLGSAGSALGGLIPGGNSNPLSAVTNGPGQLGNLANLAGMLG
ncbi:hypothetical protein PENTCL1PPCAC_29974, partial [Pristionchus entomophagus]